MSFSIVSGTLKRRPTGGGRFQWTFRASGVTSSGSFVPKASIGCNVIESVQATPVDAAVAVDAAPNSQTEATTETNPGDLWLKSGSTTVQVNCTVVGR